MRLIRKLAAIHLVAWSQTLQVLAGAIIPSARPKNRAAKVIHLVEALARDPRETINEIAREVRKAPL